jgi:hypothetical protein
VVRGQRLCVACGDQEPLYWKERAIAAEARASREEVATLRALAQLDEMRLAPQLVLAKWIKDFHETAQRSEDAEARLKAEFDTDLGENATPATMLALVSFLENLRDEIKDAMPRANCASCGKQVERARECYAVPTCYACLPPPPPLKVIGVDDE